MAFRMRDRAGGTVWAGGTQRTAMGAKSSALTEIEFSATGLALAAYKRRISGCMTVRAGQSPMPIP
jgi:hypothetical protein